jgi:hypothetical protein
LKKCRTFEHIYGNANKICLFVVGNHSKWWKGVKERSLNRYKWVLINLHILDL